MQNNLIKLGIIGVIIFIFLLTCAILIETENYGALKIVGPIAGAGVAVLLSFTLFKFTPLSRDIKESVRNSEAQIMKRAEFPKTAERNFVAGIGWLFLADRNKITKSVRKLKKCYKQSVTDRQRAAALYWQGMAQQFGGLLNQAIDNMGAAVELDDFYVYRRNLALCRMAAGDFAEARIQLEKCVEQAPEDGMSWVILGHYHAQRNDYEKCKECSLKALELMPTSSDAKWNLCLSYLHSGELDKVNEYYNALVAQGENVEELKQIIRNSSADISNIFEL